MISPNLKTAILTLSLATAWSVNALAVPPNNDPEPPPEAYTACNGKQAGEKAGFMTPQGQTSFGVCEQQQDGRLLLRSNHLGMNSGMKQNSEQQSLQTTPQAESGIGKLNAPEAAYRVCEGKKAGDEVQLAIQQDLQLTGTCQQDGDRLVFQPNNLSGGTNSGTSSTDATDFSDSPQEDPKGVLEKIKDTLKNPW